MRMRVLYLALSAALLLPAGTARSDALDDYRTLHGQMMESIGAVIVHLFSFEKDEAVVDADAALVSADQLISHVQTGEMKDFLGARGVRRVLRRLTVTRRNMQQARNLAASARRPANAVLRKARAANKHGETVDRLVAKLPVPGAVLAEKNPNSPGFHPPDRIVTFKVLARGPDGSPCEEEPQITVTNLPGANAVITTSVTRLSATTFSIAMGQDFGAARVQITACGVTDTRLIFNKGSRAFGGRAGALLDGSWSGSWSVSRPEDCQGIAGAWTANFAVSRTGRLAGTWQSTDGSSGSLGGRISGTGFANWSAGGGGSGVAFQGFIQGHSISGNFTGPKCGFLPTDPRVRGTFSGGKN
jgi:hypothetical protein